MKVILLRDVARIGRRGDVVEIPDGYALNQLIPKRWAEQATVTSLKRVAKEKATATASINSEQAEYAAAKASLSACVPTIAADANEKGHLFRAITSDEIVSAAANNGISLPLSMLKISHPIKEVGEHTLNLTHGADHFEFKVAVTKK